MATSNMADVEDDERLAYPRYGSYSQIMRTKIDNLQSEAHQLQTEGKLVEAVKRINRGLALAHRNPDLYRQRAEILVLMGDTTMALQNMQKAISLGHPNSTLLQDRLAELHSVHGEQLEKLNEHSAALTAYIKAHTLAPHCKLYTFKRIACLMQLGRYDECLSLTESELKETPSTISLLIIRAKLKMMFGNMTQAYYSVQNALELDPENKSAVKMKEELSRQAATAKRQAMDYCLTGKETEATIKLTAAIQADPSDPTHHIFRGALHRQAGRYSTAVDEYLTAINKCSHNRDSAVYKDALRQLTLTYNDFAVDCFKRKNYSDAITLLNKALKEEKNEPSLFTNRGDCFFKLKELQFALADYQRSCELAGTVEMALCYRLAVVNHSIGIQCYRHAEYKTAESHFTQSITYSPLTAHFYQCRARARYELKNDRGAREDTLRALLLNPADECSIPLIARLFPGRTITELVRSDVANKLRPSLLPARHQPSSVTESNEREPLLNKLLEDLTIQQEREAVEESSSDGTHHCSVVESPEVTSSSPQSSSPESITSPRLWSVLHSSHPSVPVTTGIMPRLKTCLEESEFHKQIIDAKKTCTEDVERLFQYTRPPSRKPLNTMLNT